MPTIQYDLIGAVGITLMCLVCALDRLWGCERNVPMGVAWMIVFGLNVIYVIASLLLEVLR